jgi:hypothetical protein
MRHLFVSAIIVAAVTAAIEAFAVVLGWSPAIWLLPALPATAGVATFLVAGRRRALRRSARRRARARAASSGSESARRVTRVTRTGHVTVVRRLRAPGERQERRLVPVREGDDTPVPH